MYNSHWWRNRWEFKLFSENISNWETLKVIRNARLKNSKSTSKWDVISKHLPNIFRKNDGYHSEGYKKYTAYNISGYITEEEVESKVSICPSTNPCSSKSSGVLEPVCLFCDKKNKKNSKVCDICSAAVRNLMLK